METMSESRNCRARDEILSSAAENANNSLWNYVSILSWLRALRAAKVIMAIFPAIFGALASWYAVYLPQNTNVVAAFAALAGFFPVLYVAVGLDEMIGYNRALAGKYRLANALFQNISRTAGRYDDHTLENEYDRAFAEYCRIREEAHTVPRWCFARAKKVISNGEYSLLPTN